MYSEKVMDHFKNPRNMGVIENPDGTGAVGNPICDDTTKMTIKVKDSIITDIMFETFGCAAAVASASLLTEEVKGKTIDEAEKIEIKDILKELGGLPEIKEHCSNMALESLKKAIEDYRKKQS